MLVTAALLSIRSSIDKTHVALAYVLVVLALSARSGRGMGLTTSIVAFLCFNFFFLPPYYTLTVADPLNWAVLVTFLVTSLIAAQLLTRARQEAASAREREKADELKNAVLASVSHDLRTPLTTIKAVAHEISEGGDDRALIIEEEADRLNTFVADLLDLSRLASGGVTLAPVVNAAEDLVGAALQRVGGAVKDRELVATLDPSEPLLLGRFDFAQSLRVLVNLIENALKFAPTGSTVEVQARRSGEALEFIVADRGPGVPPSDRETIFAPFSRGDAGPRDVTGAGLGLSIARALAEAQGGAVRHEPRPDGGSLFIFSLPAADITDLERPVAS